MRLGRGSQWKRATLSVAMLALAAGCSRRPAESPAAAIPVVVVTPQAASGADMSARYPVTIARDREAALSFRVGGTIAQAPLRIGEHVAAGALVARLNATPYRAARVRASEELARLTRAAERARALVPAGAVAPSADEDSASAVTAARAALAAARYDEASATLRAPFAGVVLARQVEVGETVAPGQAVLRLADLASPVIARTAVPQAVAATLRTGGRARVTIAGRPTLTATVRHIGAAADARTGTVDIELTLAAGTALPSGITGSASFEPSAGGEFGQRIPPEALLDAKGDMGHVFIVDPQRPVARRVPVRLNGFDGEQLSVTGLAPGARVITSGAGFVHDGERVQVQRP